FAFCNSLVIQMLACRSRLLARFVCQQGTIPLMALFRQGSAIGGGEFPKHNARRARFGKMAGNGDLVAWLLVVLVDAGHGERVRIAEFGAPMLHVTFVIGHVEQNAAVGVGPKPFGYGSIQDNLLFLTFVSR